MQLPPRYAMCVPVRSVRLAPPASSADAPLRHTEVFFSKKAPSRLRPGRLPSELSCRSAIVHWLERFEIDAQDGRTWRSARGAGARLRRIYAAVASEHATARGRVRRRTGSSTSACVCVWPRVVRLQSHRLQWKTRAAPARNVPRRGRSARAQRAPAAGFV